MHGVTSRTACSNTGRGTAFTPPSASDAAAMAMQAERVRMAAVRQVSRDSGVDTSSVAGRNRGGSIRVRFHIIRNACIEYVGESQSCMVSKLRIIRKQTVPGGSEWRRRALCSRAQVLEPTPSWRRLRGAGTGSFRTAGAGCGFAVQRRRARHAGRCQGQVVHGDTGCHWRQ